MPRPAVARRRPAAVSVLAGVLLATMVGATGCLPQRASFTPGFSTSRVTGTMDVDPAGLPAGGALVVVLKYHYTFITLESGATLRHPTAHVVSVGPEGAFDISMPSDVVAVEVLFIAPDHLTDTFQFERQVGVGTVTYRAHLPPMPQWRSHYYTFLEPQLQHYITEDRYKLSPADQQRLGEWLVVQRERLEARRSRRRPPP